MNNIKKIAKSFSTKIIAFLGFYLCDVILARGLSVDDYAEWSYFFSIINIVLWISNFGISLTIRTIVAKENEIVRRKHYVNCGIILRFLVSILFSLLFLVLSKEIAKVSGWPNQYPDLQWLMIAGCLLPLFMAFTELWKNIFIGSARLNSLLAMAVFEHLGYAIGCLVGILIFHDIKGAIAGYYFGYLLATISGSILEKVSFRGFVLSEETRKDIKNIFKSAIPYVVTCIIAFVILEMDTVMIGMFKVGNAELANYNIAKKMVRNAISVNEAFLYAMLPQFASINKGRYSEAYKRFKEILSCNLLITAAVGVGLALVLPAIVPIIYGKDYIAAGKYILALLPAYLCNGITQCFMQFLYYREKAKYVSASYSCSFIVNLVMNWTLIPRMGAMGAAIGTVASLVPFMMLLAICTIREWKRLKE